VSDMSIVYKSSISQSKVKCLMSECLMSPMIVSLVHHVRSCVLCLHCSLYIHFFSVAKDFTVVPVVPNDD